MTTSTLATILVPPLVRPRLRPFCGRFHPIPNQDIVCPFVVLLGEEVAHGGRPLLHIRSKRIGDVNMVMKDGHH